MAQSVPKGCVTMCDGVHADLDYSALDAEPTSYKWLR